MKFKFLASSLETLFKLRQSPAYNNGLECLSHSLYIVHAVIAVSYSDSISYLCKNCVDFINVCMVRNTIKQQCMQTYFILYKSSMESSWLL